MFDSRSGYVEFMVDKSAIGSGFLQACQFPLPVLIPPTAPYTSIIQGWYRRPTFGQCTKWAQRHPIPQIKKCIYCVKRNDSNKDVTITMNNLEREMDVFNVLIFKL
jgi:hypothetical protein